MQNFGGGKFLVDSLAIAKILPIFLIMALLKFVKIELQIDDILYMAHDQQLHHSLSLLRHMVKS